jgi:hypothetical protein
LFSFEIIPYYSNFAVKANDGLGFAFMMPAELVLIAAVCAPKQAWYLPLFQQEPASEINAPQSWPVLPPIHRNNLVFRFPNQLDNAPLFVKFAKQLFYL